MTPRVKDETVYKRPTENKECLWCKEVFESERSRKRQYCSRKCSGLATGSKRAVDRTRNCAVCDVVFTPSDSRVLACGRSCGAKLAIKNNPEKLEAMYVARDEKLADPEEISKRSERMRRMWGREKFRSEVIDRMTNSNPTQNPEVRQKISNTLKDGGHDFSHLTGGNGVVNIREELIVKLLGEGWETQYIYVTSGEDRAEGSPHHYKIDVANPLSKVAVEIDGRSHTLLSRRAQDERKTKCLERAGWLVIRVTNEEVDENPEALARQIALNETLRTPNG